MFEVGKTYHTRKGEAAKVVAVVQVSPAEQRLLVVTDHGEYETYGTRKLDGTHYAHSDDDLINPEKRAVVIPNATKAVGRNTAANDNSPARR